MENNVKLTVLTPHGDFVERFLNNYKSENTKAQYKVAILEFFSAKNTYEINKNMIVSVTVPQAKLYIQSLIDKGFERSTVVQKRAALSSLWNELIGEYEGQFIDKNPWENITIKRLMENALPKEDENPQGIILKKHEIERLLLKAKAHKQRNFIILRILLNCGLRRYEVGKLRFSDFFQVENKAGELEWFVHVDGKGRKKRTVFVNDSLIEDITVYFEDKTLGDSNEFLFGLSGDRVNKIVKKYAKDINPEISAHDLRHTNITHLALAGVSAAQLQKHAGHSSINTTMKYINLIEDYENCAGKAVTW